MPRRHHKAWEDLHNSIGGPQVTTKPLSRLGFQEPKSKKLNELSLPNLRGELKPMHQMQWQEHTKCSNPSLPNPTKATNAMEGYERKNKGRNPQRTPRSRSNGFPSQRGESDWWKCRSRSPLSFPLKRCKKHGGNGGGRASFEGQQWRREKPKNVVGSRRKKGIYR